MHRSPFALGCSSCCIFTISKPRAISNTIVPAFSQIFGRLPRYLPGILLFFFAFTLSASAQHNGKIDKHAASVGFHPIDTLVAKLAPSSYSDSEKVRSFYYWLTENIEYDVDEYHYHYHQYQTPPSGLDSIALENFWEMDLANYVLKRKKGMCSGYARLFRQMCVRANIECKLIEGYGKQGLEKMGLPFKQNHEWNAVKLNGKWRLLDICWAAGYCSNYTTSFTKQRDESYYMTDPAQFIYDHYPTDSAWTLLDKPPSKQDFVNFPHLFCGKNRFKFTNANLRGIYWARLGDTVRIEIELPANASFGLNNHYITGFDNLKREQIPGPGAPKPSFKKQGNKLIYSYPVWSKTVSHLYVTYGGEQLAAYRLRLKK